MTLKISHLQDHYYLHNSISTKLYSNIIAWLCDNTMHTIVNMLYYMYYIIIDTSTTDFKQNSNLSWLEIQHLYNSYVYSYIAPLVRYYLSKDALI